MSVTKNVLRNINVIITAKTIKGTKFVGIRGYENSKNEISNQTLLVGYNYPDMLKNDLQKLKELDINSVIAKYGKEVANKAYTELIVALTKLTTSEIEKAKLLENNDKTLIRSNAQINAFTTLAKGIKVHNETNKLYVNGLVVSKTIIQKGVSKTIIQKGVYKKVNSRPKTLGKNEIKKLANLRSNKLRRFIFDSVDNINLQGVTI